VEKCLQYGSYIIVGIHTDQEVNHLKGANFPIMNLFERTLTVLSCKYVSNVVIGAPCAISEELLKSFSIDLVLTDSFLKNTDVEKSSALDSYEVPKRLGIYKEVDSGFKLSTDVIIKRIIDNRLAFEKRNRDKESKELSVNF